MATTPELESTVERELEEMRAIRAISMSEVEQAIEELNDDVAGAAEAEETEDSNISTSYSRFLHGADPNPIYLEGSKVDYNEIFGFLGQTKTRNLYDSINLASPTSASLFNDQDGSRLTADDVRIVVQVEKYTKRQPGLLGVTGLVPNDPRISSEKWEKLKMEYQLDKVMEALDFKVN